MQEGREGGGGRSGRGEGGVNAVSVIGARALKKKMARHKKACKGQKGAEMIIVLVERGLKRMDVHFAQEGSAPEQIECVGRPSGGSRVALSCWEEAE